LVAIEGPDGAGKSSAATRLTDRLRDEGRSVVLTREPGGTHLGELVRAILLDAGPGARSPRADALLFNAARSQLVAEVIRPALARGDLVICDRFAASTLAYQGYGSGVDLDVLRSLESFALDGTEPDLVVLLDVPAAVGLARRHAGNPAERTRFEDGSRFDAAFHERVRRGFLELARADPERWRVIDAALPPEQVDRALLAALVPLVSAGEPRRPLLRNTG
jgi:dTMP kinase